MQARTATNMAFWLWWLLTLAACSNEEAETLVAVTNQSEETISVALSDGQTELMFENVAASTTSTFQTAKFASYAAVEVIVGNDTNHLDLFEGETNVIVIGADGEVRGVRRAASAPATETGGW